MVAVEIDTCVMGEKSWSASMIWYAQVGQQQAQSRISRPKACVAHASLSSSFALLQTEDLAAKLEQYHIGERYPRPGRAESFAILVRRKDMKLNW
jgi:hypothetical protein